MMLRTHPIYEKKLAQTLLSLFSVAARLPKSVLLSIAKGRSVSQRAETFGDRVPQGICDTISRPQFSLSCRSSDSVMLVHTFMLFVAMVYVMC